MNATVTLVGARAEAPAAVVANTDSATCDVFQRIGTITRRLHDALRELGYDKALESALDSLPDARSRLSYIAKLTGESANKVLNTVEFAQATQEEMAQGAKALLMSWKGKTAQSLTGPADELLVADTSEFLASLSMSTDLTRHYLTDIMLAQDFHDLTGQVIRKVIDLAQTLEDQLLAVLLEATPLQHRAKILTSDSGFMSGPVVHGDGRDDIVTNQSQVDELLERLGF